MGDGKGAFTVTDFKSPYEPNEGLGYQICPDGKQDHAYEAIMKDMCKLDIRISSSLLLENEARQVLHQRLIPKLGCKMKLTYITQW